MTIQDFSAQELKEGLGHFFEKGFSHIRVIDTSITENKAVLLQFLKDIAKKEPLVLFELCLSIEILDKNILDAVLEIGASLLISYKTNDTKIFSKKIRILNELGISFGFIVEIESRSLKNRKDFARLLEDLSNYYPNHVYFHFAKDFAISFTEKDATFIRMLAISFELFYTEGRAVPWFKSLLLTLKISSFALISDFYEWLILNNYIDSFAKDLPQYTFLEILKMQLLFVQFKLEEKNLVYLYPLIEDILRLHGFFSEVLIEGVEKELELHYHPEDLLNQAAHFLDFYETFCEERCKISIFLTKEGLDFEVF